MGLGGLGMAMAVGGVWCQAVLLPPLVPRLRTCLFRSLAVEPGSPSGALAFASCASRGPCPSFIVLLGLRSAAHLGINGAAGP